MSTTSQPPPPDPADTLAHSMLPTELVIGLIHVVISLLQQLIALKPRTVG